MNNFRMQNPIWRIDEFDMYIDILAKKLNAYIMPKVKVPMLLNRNEMLQDNGRNIFRVLNYKICEFKQSIYYIATTFILILI